MSWSRSIPLESRAQGFAILAGMAAEHAVTWQDYLAELPPVQQQAIRETKNPPHLFSVISWGRAATTWLAHVLNSHPDIFCLHASNHVWRDLGGARDLDGVRYLQIVRAMGRTCLAAGDVHGVGRDRIPELRAAYGSEFSAAALVRDPMARIASQMAFFENYAEHDWGIAYIDKMIEYHQLDLPDQEYPTKFFVHAVNMLNAIDEEVRICKVFRQEDITTDPMSLKALVAELTAGKVSPTEAWYEQAVGTRPINVFPRTRPILVPQDWQLHVLRKVVTPSAWKIYEELGYPVPAFLK